jgi:hypothetical protein
MYEDDIQDSAIVEQINRRDAAQIKESVRHIHQHAQPAILAFAKSYCRFFNVSSEVESHINNFAVAWQEQQAGAQ